MSQSLPKSARILKSKEYAIVSRYGKRYVGSIIVADVICDEDSPNKIGITASRKFGNAVARNRFKRIVRESFRCCRDKFSDNLTVCIRPRHYALHATPSDITTELVDLLGSYIKI